MTKIFLLALALLLNSQLVLALQFGRPIAPAKAISIYTTPSEQSATPYKNVNLVSVGKCIKDWCGVSFLLENEKNKSVWVKASSITIQSKIDIDEEKIEECGYYKADPIVTASVNRFKCKESLFTKGYESCELVLTTKSRLHVK